MNISLEKIKTILRLEDIEGYIEYHGAPEDEYDSEAKEILVALNQVSDEEMTETNIASIITPLWGKLFNLDENDLEKRRGHLMNVSRVILS